MRSRIRSLHLVVLLVVGQCITAFTTINMRAQVSSKRDWTRASSVTTRTVATTLRGGSTELRALPAASEVIIHAMQLVQTNVRSGPLGILALTSVAASICIPLVQIKNLYGIGVGYGSSVAAIGLAVRLSFAPTKGSLGDYLTQAAIFYGARLAGYLLLRDMTSLRSLETKEDPARWRRVPFAISVALFYSFMTAPLMYTLRHAPAVLTGWKSAVAWTGASLAWAGAILETVADNQKYVLKQRIGADESNSFHGPYTGVYRLTRHPNYTGEVLYWLGIYIAGVPFFGRSVQAWLWSTLGLMGIISIMRAATRKLEERQAEKYGGQGAYENWKEEITSPLIPFCKGC